ncbi:T9SS type A sorting domain-containing protein [Fulvivirga sp. M361]|uniref:T9SS type A sorting domain-containing protein n=1 Tax=Fulvivirga sp. M361 TaxID=2594266 RepID=UPI00117B24A2|nr:T9SS type A sorting domain-containing protein [Fulvivirga sp. M361]TRX60186.1 T9SS type A sorting domain-containing protein [Fulvivirga sp. M361]
MKTRLPLFLLLPVFLLVVAPLNAQISASIQGMKQTTLDCKSTATVDVTYTGNYVASAFGGTLIIDPSTGDEVPILVTNAASLDVKTSFGSGKIFVSDPGNSMIIDSVQVNVVDLNTLVGSITLAGGGNCVSSTGEFSLTVPVDPRAIGDVEYSWAVVRGREHTSIDATTRNSQTVTLNSLNAGTSLIRVTVTNDCSGEFCASPARFFTVRKTLSVDERNAIAITGAECTSDDVLGEDNLIVLSVPPVLGRWDPGQYQWIFPQDKLQQEFRSGDGSAIAFKVLDNSANITVSLNLGSACNPGLTYTKVLRAPAPVPQFASSTFCVSEAPGTQEVFTVANSAPGFAYNWILPQNWVIISSPSVDSTQVTVQFNNSSTGNITVVSSNQGCGSEFKPIQVNRFPIAAPNIVGPTCVTFEDTQELTYNVQGGDNTYTWEILPASAGWVLSDNQLTQNGPTIKIVPSFASIPADGHVTIRATIDGNCGGSSILSELVVSIGPDAPPMIIGDECVVDPMPNVIFSINPVDRATGYTWETPASWSRVNVSGTQAEINTNGHSGIIKVNALGCAPDIVSDTTSLTVNVAPAAPGAIDFYVNGDPANDCIVKGSPQNVTFTIPSAVSGATSYIWSFPSGWNPQSLTTVDGTILEANVTSDNSSAGSVSVVANGVASCSSMPATLDVIRSGLDFCVTSSLLFGTFYAYEVKNLSEDATFYYWENENGEYIADGVTTNMVATNTQGISSIKVSITDLAGCITSLDIPVTAPSTETAPGVCSLPPVPAPINARGTSFENNLSGSSSDQNSLMIFPNPVEDGILNITMPFDWENVSFQIYSPQGKLLTVINDFKASQATLDMSGYTSGTYHAIINSSKGMMHKRIFVK